MRNAIRLLAAACLLEPAIFGQGSTEADRGIPVADPLVIAKCSTCHSRDERGNIDRISWTRTTPEGWQAVLRRMVLANGLTVTADEARGIVKSLSASHGLAPEEARTVEFLAERRMHDETAERASRAACAQCHSSALALSWRRSPAEWQRFVRVHAEERKFSAGDDTIRDLARTAALHTPEWDSWSGRKGDPDPSGRWLVTATLPGHGLFSGELLVEKAQGGELTTSLHLTSARDGSTLRRNGRATVYGGCEWRGRSEGDGARFPANPSGTANNGAAREAMWMAGDGAWAEGRWFWGQYQEFGFDVHLSRPMAGPALLAVDRVSLKVGTQGTRIRLFGSGLPPEIVPADLDLGHGVKARSIVSNTATEIVAQVDVAPDADTGPRTIAFRGAILPRALVVYDRVDYVKVVPDSSVASFADRSHAPGYLQFEAIGYQRGPDGRLHTDDDLNLGPVDVEWSVQLFHSPEGSNAAAVGSMTSDGLFVPAAGNPGNNFDTWVSATARNERNAEGIPLVGKSYLVVTVPSYIFNGRRYVRDLDRWVDDGPASEGSR